MSAIYIGYDPGGGGAHGVAAISENDCVSDTLLTAKHAVDWFVMQAQNHNKVVMGVDTLTLWSTGPAGWRPADRALRARYPAIENSVQSPNSLRGSMPINGAAVVMELKNYFKSIIITETHPKVLYYALTNNVYDFPGVNNQMTVCLRQFLGVEELPINSEHAWDALISAYAAKQWDTGEWQNDLHLLAPHDDEHLVSFDNDGQHFIWPHSFENQDKS